MVKRKVLIADDETKMRILISDFLEDCFEVLEARDGREAIDIFLKEKDISLVILDIMMPHYNGMEVMKKIREVSKVPIIMLTAKNTEQDEIDGLMSGADEYIKKPFSPSVLVARVHSIMKRIYPEQNTLKKGVISVDLEKHLVNCLGREIKLSATEFELLKYFMINEGCVLERQLLLDTIWGFDYMGTDRTVDTTINRLRNKLKPECDYIKTNRGYGYKFEVKE